MTQTKQLKEEYVIPLAETGESIPDILCDSPLPWGNEDLTGGEEWKL